MGCARETWIAPLFRDTPWIPAALRNRAPLAGPGLAIRGEPVRPGNVPLALFLPRPHPCRLGANIRGLRRSRKQRPDPCNGRLWDSGAPDPFFFFLLDDDYRCAMPRRARKRSVSSEQWRGEHFGKCQVHSVIGGDVFAKLPDTWQQNRVGVTIERKIRQVRQGFRATPGGSCAGDGDGDGFGASLVVF
jgi:hypothetical protein